MSRIYLASSWRNDKQQKTVKFLENLGHEVYDFKNPPHGLGGFQWSDLDKNWKNWDPVAYRDNLLKSHIAAAGYLSNFRAMKWCDTCILLLPCGRSAHLELGWCSGAGKRTIIFIDDGEPELMNLLADDIVVNYVELTEVLKV